MKKQLIVFLVALMFILSLELKKALSAEIVFTPRDNVIFVTMSQMQERESAIAEAMMEAQLRLAELETRTVSKVTEAGRGGGAFGDLFNRIHPYITSVIELQDNTYQTHNDKRARVSYKYTLGAKMNFYGQGKSLNLDLFLNDTRYQQNYRRGTIEDINFNLLANMPLGRYNLSITDEVFSNYVTIDELGTKHVTTNELGTEINKMERYWSNKAGVKLGRTFNRIGFDFGASHADYLNHPKSSSSSRTEDKYTGNIYLRVGTKTQVQGTYEYYTRNYTHYRDPTPNKNYNDFILSITTVLTPKLTGLLKVDYKPYNNEDRKQEHKQKMDATGKISYLLSQRTDFALTYDYLFQDSTVTTDSYFQDIFSLTGNHRLAFNPKFQLSFGCKFDSKNYLKQKLPATTHWYRLTSGLSYAFRQWLDFSLNYIYDLQNGKATPDSTYENNMVTFKTQAKF